MTTSLSTASVTQVVVVVAVVTVLVVSVNVVMVVVVVVLDVGVVVGVVIGVLVAVVVSPHMNWPPGYISVVSSKSAMRPFNVSEPSLQLIDCVASPSSVNGPK